MRTRNFQITQRTVSLTTAAHDAITESQPLTFSAMKRIITHALTASALLACGLKASTESSQDPSLSDTSFIPTETNLGTVPARAIGGELSPDGTKLALITLDDGQERVWTDGQYGPSYDEIVAGSLVLS